MKNLTMKRSIAAAFTADDWELFFEDGREAAALEMNKALEDAVNAPDATPDSVLTAMEIVQEKFAKLGAGDSEPQHLIDDVIDKAFGER